MNVSARLNMTKLIIMAIDHQHYLLIVLAGSDRNSTTTNNNNVSITANDHQNLVEATRLVN